MASEVTLDNHQVSPARQVRIVIFGDSIAHGQNDAANLGGWPGRLL